MAEIHDERSAICCSTSYELLRRRADYGDGGARAGRYGYLAFMILPVYAALDRMDPALIEAGKDLYGSG